MRLSDVYARMTNLFYVWKNAIAAVVAHVIIGSVWFGFTEDRNNPPVANSQPYSYLCANSAHSFLVHILISD